MLRQHPFFRLWKLTEFESPWLGFERGSVKAPIGRFFTNDLYSRFQAVLEDGLKELADRDDSFRGAKIRSLAKIQEIGNLNPDAFGKILGSSGYELFSRTRHELFRKLYPRQLTVVLSYACNLNCEFCFSSELGKKEPGGLDRPYFEKICTWMDGKGFEFVSLFGGEPTIHPDFLYFVGELNNRGYRVYFATNGLYDNRVAERLKDHDIVKATFNIPAARDIDRKRIEKLKSNLRLFPEKAQVSFRLTLAETNSDFELLHELLEEFTPSSISFALAFPADNQTNDFVKCEEISSYVPGIMHLIELAREKGIVAALVKPVPFCRLTEEESLALIMGTSLLNSCDIHQDGFTQLTTLSHTGHFYPCISLAKYRSLHLDANPALADIGDYNRGVVEQLRQKPILADCADCNLYASRICQGFCYAYYATSS